MRRDKKEACALIWKDWLTRATRKITMHPDYFVVRRELLDHLEDRAECLRRLYPDMGEEEIHRRALRAMGPAEEVGEELAKAHSKVWGILYWATLFLSRMAVVLVTLELLVMLGKVILPLTVYQWLF